MERVEIIEVTTLEAAQVKGGEGFKLVTIIDMSLNDVRYVMQRSTDTTNWFVLSVLALLPAGWIAYLFISILLNA